MLTLPKTNPLNPAVEKFLLNYDPNDATTKWTTGLGGAWIESPLASLEKSGHELPAELVAKFAENTRLDYIDRGILKPNFMEAGFDELAPNNDPADGPDKGDNAWDHLHFGGISLLDDLHARGYLWARDFAFRLLISYYNNKNTPWLRDAGVSNGYQLYGGNGRARCAGWILHALLRCHRIAKRASLPQFVTAIEQLLWFHVAKSIEAMPFIENGQGDSPLGPTVKHYRIFMIAILVSALRRCYLLSGGSGPGAPIADALDKLIAIIKAARRGPAIYAYDLACDDAGVPYQHEKETLTNGVSGVGMWLVDAFKWKPGSELAELVSDADAQSWKIKQPVLHATFIQ